MNLYYRKIIEEMQIKYERQIEEERLKNQHLQLEMRRQHDEASSSLDVDLLDDQKAPRFWTE